MGQKSRFFLLLVFFLLIACGNEPPQTAVNTDYIVVDNEIAIWGNDPKIDLKLIRIIGGENESDENYDFYSARSFTIDSQGNLYTLFRDLGLIRKYGSDGNFLDSFGRIGQGPGEFQQPVGVQVDNSGNIYVDDMTIQKILVLDSGGDEIKRFDFKFNSPRIGSYFRDSIVLNSDNIIRRNFMQSPPNEENPGSSSPLIPLFFVFDNEGIQINALGRARDFDDWYMNYQLGYYLQFINDDKDNIYVTFERQNRIEKYSPDGKLLLRISRPLNYKETTTKDMYLSEATGNWRLRYNTVSSGIAVDNNERIWVVTRRMQRRDNENDILNQFDIFDKNGVLLAQIPFEKIAGNFFQHFSIYGDKVYIMYKLALYIYEIVELD